MNALRQASFRRLAVGLLASQLGDWIYNVALLAYVFDRTHSGAWLGATTAARVLPVVLLGPLGGVLAGRLDRRRLMIGADLVRIAVMLALTAVTAFGLAIGWVPALAALATAAGSAYPACTAVSLPGLVAPEDLTSANAVRAVIGPVCVVTGPALGALTLALSGAPVAFALNAVTFGVSAVAVALIAERSAFRRRPRPHHSAFPAGSSPLHRLRADLAGGASALFRHRGARRLVTADILSSGVYGVLTVALLLVARHSGLGAGGYGLLLGAAGAGGIAGSVMGARLDGHRGALAAGLLLVALPLPALATALSVPALLALAALSGAGSSLVEVLAETGLQRDLPGEVLPRAYGFAFPAAVGGICVGGAVAAPLIDLVGLLPALTAVATVVVAYGLWTLPAPGLRPVPSA